MSTDIMRFVTARPIQRVGQLPDNDQRVPRYIALGDIVGDDFGKYPAVDFKDVDPFVALDDTPLFSWLDDFLITVDDRAEPDNLIELIKQWMHHANGDFLVWVAKTLPNQVNEVVRAFVAATVWSAPSARPPIPTEFSDHWEEYLLLLRRARNELHRRVYMGVLVTLITSDGYQAGRVATANDVHDLLRNSVLLLPGGVPTHALALARVPVVADLCVIRQELDRYEAGEIAHVENVLRGEARQREHRVHQLREETLTVEEEQEKETTQDLQTADRFELQREIAKTTQNDTDLQAGCTLSGSYGPVAFTADTSYSSRTSTQDQTREATRYAHDVVQRTVERIRERTRQQRVTRVLVETEEKNTHGFAVPAEAEADVVGVYRFIDKVYRAQVFNYGKRLLAEFVVPQPACFLRYTRTKNDKEDKAQRPVPAPVVTRPEQITAGNYEELLSSWGVPTAEHQIPATEVVKNDFVKSDTLPSPTGGLWNGSTSITLDDGYAADKISFTVMVTRHNSDYKEPPKYLITASGMMTIDDKITWDPAGGGDLIVNYQRVHADNPLNPAMEHILNIGLMFHQVDYVEVNITVHTTVTPTHIRTWQQKVFDAVFTAYNNQRQEQADRAAQAQLAEQQEAAAVNPADHRTIERNELKKHVIDMLGSTGVNEYPADPIKDEDQDGAADKPPYIDVAAMAVVRDDIQFFEQAFEWPQMTYVLYPYYWALPVKWRELFSQDDSDSLYEEFLRAGAARVVVPVRPNFETAALLYFATGIPWATGQAPQIGDPLYLSAVDEIRGMQDTTGGTPVGEPWEIRLPTDLIILQSQVKQLENLIPQPAEGHAKPATTDLLEGVPVPAGHGRIGWFGGPDDPSAGDTMALTGEPCRKPQNSWYCAMRWPYTEEIEDKAWYAGKRIIVSAHGRHVVLRAADYGPGQATGRVLNVSPQAMTYLSVDTDDEVDIAWATDQNLPLGPAATG
jgi:hypothetical protein